MRSQSGPPADASDQNPSLPNEPAGTKRRGARWRRRTWMLGLLLLLSVIVNLVFWARYDRYYEGSEPPPERFVRGERGAEAKIARIEINGTIMPPFTERLLKSLERAEQDPAIKGVLLVVDSPGGLVADSHEIYHRLTDLRQKKPVAVAMRRIAASGGLYVAMGAGPEGLIFAQPATWTGSIGVIIPRYEFTGLAEKVGVEPGSLKTGPMKDSLNPIRPLSDRERDVWNAILDESFDRFVKVIDQNRTQLDESKIRDLATGEILTASQAKKAGLIDHIGFEEDALAALKAQAGIERARVVEYEFPGGLLELLVPAAASARPNARMKAALDRSTPRAYYHCGAARLPADMILQRLP